MFTNSFWTYLGHRRSRRNTYSGHWVCSYKSQTHRGHSVSLTVVCSLFSQLFLFKTTTKTEDKTLSVTQWVTIMFQVFIRPLNENVHFTDQREAEYSHWAQPLKAADLTCSHWLQLVKHIIYTHTLQTIQHRRAFGSVLGCFFMQKEATSYGFIYRTKKFKFNPAVITWNHLMYHNPLVSCRVQYQFNDSQVLHTYSHTVCFLCV